MSDRLRRVAITGSSGYYGGVMLRELRRRVPGIHVLGLDRQPPTDDAPDEFVQADVRGSQLREALTAFAPDTLLHLAAVVNPLHDEQLMTDVNVGGTENVLTTAATLPLKRLFIASSATAYGAWPDNPVPMDESARLRPRNEFRYAADKTAVEGLASRFADEYPDIAVSWTRPTVVVGPGVRNYLSDLLLRGPVVVLPSGADTPLQFVHEEDLTAATWTILERDGRGPYNVAPPDWLPLSELAAASGRRTVSIPLGACRAGSAIWWALRIPLLPFPPGLWLFMGHPWVVTPRRLTEELGFTFARSSREAVLTLLRQDQA